MDRMIIYLNAFMHNSTKLVRLFSYDSEQLSALVQDLEYVNYSYLYKCFYIRNTKLYLDRLKQDIAGKAILNIKHFNSFHAKADTDANASEVIRSWVPVVAIAIKENKGYLKFKNKAKYAWIEFVKSLNGIYNEKRNVWILSDYNTIRGAIHDFFSANRCKIEEVITNQNYGEIIQRHRVEYWKDPEVKEFIKTLTLQAASKRTIENYASQINKIKEYFRGQSIATITDEQMRDYLFFLRDDLNFSFSSQNIVISAFKRYIESMTDRQINAHLLPRAHGRKKLPQVVGKEVMQKILKHKMNLKHKCILYMLYATGMRRDELVNLKVEDVNFEDNIIIIKNGKGGKGRIVVLANKIKELLLIYLKQYQPIVYFFEGQNGGQYSGTSIARIVKRTKDECGIEGALTPHVFRHSYATHLHNSGIDIRNIQKLLGHASTKTTEIYTHISKKDINTLRSPLDDLDI